MVCLRRTFRVPFSETAFARVVLVATLLTGDDVDFVGFTDVSELEIVVWDGLLDFVDELQDGLVRPVERTAELGGRLVFHPPDNVEHLRNRHAVLGEDHPR